MLSGPNAVTSRAKHEHCSAGTTYLDLLCEVISFHGERLPELIEESRSLFRRHEYKARLHAQLHTPLMASSRAIAHHQRQIQSFDAFSRVSVANVTRRFDMHVS